jgi:hypothetical protein
VSFWEYERGRKICLQNLAAGDFSNLGGPPSDPEERLRLIQWAKDELKVGAAQQTREGSEP